MSVGNCESYSANSNHQKPEEHNIAFISDFSSEENESLTLRNVALWLILQKPFHLLKKMNTLKRTAVLQRAALRSLSGQQSALQKLACSDLVDRATLSRREAQPGAGTAGTGIVSRSFYHSSIKQESTLIIGGAGLLVGSVIVGKLMDMSAAKAAADAEKPTEGAAGEAEAEVTASASDASGNDENMRNVHREDTNAPAQENTTKASTEKEEAAAAAARKAAKKVEKEKNAGKPSFVDEVMTDVYTAFGKDWKEAKAGFFAKNFYDGGFEDKMTRREAALILGVRENTAIQRIKESHRKVLLLNHPDRGGSPYVAAKINLAKDLLLKGK